MSFISFIIDNRYIVVYVVITNMVLYGCQFVIPWTLLSLLLEWTKTVNLYKVGQEFVIVLKYFKIPLIEKL